MGGFQTAVDSSMGFCVLLDVPISLSPDGKDVFADFVVILCTAPLLLGAPLMDIYGVCLCWDSHQLEIYLEHRPGRAPWSVEAPRIILPFYIDSRVMGGAASGVPSA